MENEIIEIDDYVNGYRVIYVDKENNEIKTDSTGMWQSMKFEDVNRLVKRKDFEEMEKKYGV